MRRCLTVLLALLFSSLIFVFNGDRLASGQPPARRQRPAAEPAAGGQPAAAEQPPAAPEPLRTAGDRPINIEHIRLDLKVDLPKKTVDAKATLKVHSLRPLTSITLDAVDFEVGGVAI